MVVALAPEARPLISHYRLRPRKGAFRIFQNGPIALVISGMGKAASAAATAYIHAQTGEEERALWLNFGIAGHRTRSVGEGILAKQIRDSSRRRQWRLHPPEVSSDTATVITVDRVEWRFETDGIYEMEAAGFYPTALRFSAPELIQCFKVISDNASFTTRLVTPGKIEKLIEGRLDEIVEVLDKTAQKRKAKA